MVFRSAASQGAEALRVHQVPQTRSAMLIGKSRGQTSCARVPSQETRTDRPDSRNGHRGLTANRRRASIAHAGRSGRRPDLSPSVNRVISAHCDQCCCLSNWYRPPIQDAHVINAAALRTARLRSSLGRSNLMPTRPEQRGAEGVEGAACSATARPSARTWPCARALAC